MSSIQKSWAARWEHRHQRLNQIWELRGHGMSRESVIFCHDITIVALALMLLFIPFVAAIDRWLVVSTLLTAMACATSVLIASHLGYLRTAKNIFLLTGWVFIGLVAWQLGPSSDVHWCYLALVFSVGLIDPGRGASRPWAHALWVSLILFNFYVLDQRLITMDDLPPEKVPWIRIGVFCTLFPYVVLQQFISRRLVRQSDEQRSAALRKMGVLFDSLSEGVMVRDGQNRVIQFNQAASEILGMSPDQLMGRGSIHPKWRAIKADGSEMTGDDLPSMRTLKTGEELDGVVMGVERPDGDVRWLSVRSVPLEFSEEPKVLVTFRDVTENQKLLTELNESRTRVEIALRTVKFGIWDWIPKSGKLVWDDQMYRVFGVSPGSFRVNYESFRSLILPEDAKKMEEDFVATVERRGDFSTEFRIHRGDGNIRWVRSETKCFYDGNGQVTRVVGANWDVTEEREQQIRLLQSSKMSSLGEMAGGIAHEINNPLAVIRGKAHQVKTALDRHAEPDVIKRHADIIDQTVERIAQIVRGLRAFARDGEKDSFEIKSVREIVDETLAFCQTRFAHHEIELQVNPVSEYLMIECRAVQISQVLLNLILNSFDAVQDLPERWVKLDVVEAPGEVRFYIKDSGKGIRKDLAEKIFEPFFTTKAAGKGTGLGLSIAANLIKAHGGTIQVDPHSAHTCFIVRLPKKQSQQLAA